MEEPMIDASLEVNPTSKISKISVKMVGQLHTEEILLRCVEKDPSIRRSRLTIDSARRHLLAAVQQARRSKCYKCIWFCGPMTFFRKNEVPPPPRPHTGPAATITAGGVDFTPSAPPAPSSPLPTTSEHTADPAELLVSHVKEMTKLPYAQLEEVTDGFAATRLLGGGAWGQVYQATLPRLGPVAIKRLHLAVTGGPWEPLQQFHNEIDVLAQLSHPNLLPLLGYSEDGPALCLAYKYMRHGSLLDRLACTNGRQPLQWCDRLVIGLGSARGLCHLHTVLERPLVHRDVKSANILLDDNFVPKLGDFGLVRMGSNANHTQTAAITTNVIGTSAYMAPEAYRGDVSVKMDVFSFGVVLLELLTGLPPYDENREGHDLITHVDDADNRNELVDNRAGNWPQHVVQQMFELSDLCLYEKKRRPLMPAVIEKLEPLIC
ncbi:interleukin-1 receptor-associated kinase 4-like isoform X2 [Macrosteles quadrilineatus]|uniref:interleukin-1 receptor-associated kinase 4-like isoform X2 n=1 Tax=Macrosteles quadrilineatus TaxID=74068 RepID=UPI0023E1AAA6|nr:interleukin-1 receptor-associated kinase 4-like isoform X2 [Macrosteles quadrilineatus]